MGRTQNRPLIGALGAVILIGATAWWYWPARRVRAAGT